MIDTAGANRRGRRSTRRSLEVGLPTDNLNMDDAGGLLGLRKTVDPPEALQIRLSGRVKFHSRMPSPTLGEKASRPRNVTPFATEISKSPKREYAARTTIQLSGDDSEE